MTGRRLLPYPLVTLGLFLGWLLLWDGATPGAILLGLVGALGATATLAALAPPRAHLRRLQAVPGLLLLVLVEILRSNNAIARIILQPGEIRIRRSGFVRIPLDMRSPHGLAALACIVTATPGTVWVDYDAGEGSMLLHVLDLIDEEAWIRIIKERWERRLMEIFE